MENKTKYYTPDDPLLSAKECSMEVNCCLSQFWKLVKENRLPKPYYISNKLPRWKRSELRAAIEVTKAS